MATIDAHITKRAGISTLDVLWAFYQSQPRHVKKAFRSRMAEEENTIVIPQWQKDLKEIKALKDNWDGEGATKINRTAIRNAQQIAEQLSEKAAAIIRLYASKAGAVMIKAEAKLVRIKGEIGDQEMSYFVKRSGTDTEYHSFEPLTTGNISQLANYIETIAE